MTVETFETGRPQDSSLEASLPNATLERLAVAADREARGILAVLERMRQERGETAGDGTLAQESTEALSEVIVETVPELIDSVARQYIARTITSESDGVQVSRFLMRDEETEAASEQFELIYEDGKLRQTTCIMGVGSGQEPYKLTFSGDTYSVERLASEQLDGSFETFWSEVREQEAGKVVELFCRELAKSLAFGARRTPEERDEANTKAWKLQNVSAHRPLDRFSTR